MRCIRYDVRMLKLSLVRKQDSDCHVRLRCPCGFNGINLENCKYEGILIEFSDAIRLLIQYK